MSAQQAGVPARIQAPPPTGNQAFDQWARNVWLLLNNMPRVSWFSGVTPNSVWTGTAGDLAINLASASTHTRIWVMGGAPSYVTNKNWFPLALGAP